MIWKGIYEIMAFCWTFLQVGRLFPSIRFARTVLLIMIPMWVFILPIVTIIPLHRGCEDGNKSELNCDLVGTLWRYLVIHMRSILPLQAILDTLIYAFGSKEFRQAMKKLLKKYRQAKWHRVCRSSFLRIQITDITAYP